MSYIERKRPQNCGMRRKIMKIVVLAGGISTEREISIVSGTQVCKALRSRGHQAILVDVYFGREDADPMQAFTDEYDVDAAAAYARSFDGQAAFDLLGIRYTGSGYLGSAIAMDKGLSKQLFWQNEVPTPAGFILRKGEDISLEAHGMTLPCVVKPCCGGSSVGVTIPKTQEEYEAAVADAFSYEDVIVVEEYIKGREFSVGVVDGIAYPIIEIAPIEGFYDYTNKYKAGSTVETCPAVLTKEQTEQMQAYAVKGFKALQLDNYGRLDFMMSKDGKMYCLEANTLPGMTPTSLLPQEAQALGMDFADLCEKLIAVSAK